MRSGRGWEGSMSYSVTIKRQDGDQGQAGDATVRYADVQGGAGGFLAQPIVLRAAALPNPAPDEIRVTFAWAEAAVRPPAERTKPAPAESGAPAGPSTRGQKIAKGDRVEVIKSRVSRVKSPPEWLEQYVGRTGVVLWTTADGAMVDLGPDTAWFSYQELRPKE
jgi:hypothetical protein